MLIFLLVLLRVANEISVRVGNHYSRRENYDSDYKRFGYDHYEGDDDKRHPRKKKASFLEDLSDF